MRILHILDHSIPLHSGYTFRTLAILRQQRNRGWETEHITSTKHYAAKQKEEIVDSLHFYRTLPKHSLLERLPVLNQYSVVESLYRHLNEIIPTVRPDILHAHSPALNGLAALWAGRRHDLPVVYEMRASWEDAATNHGTTREGSLRYRMSRGLETYVLKRADAITTISAGLRDHIIERGIPERSVNLIPNAVDVDRFEFIDGRCPSPIRRRLGLGNQTVLGFIGSFYGYEGLDLLLEAVPEIRERHPGMRVLLVGGGFQEDALKDQVKNQGLDDTVVFTGRVPHEEVHEYYAAIDILVYPRRHMRLTDIVTPLKPLEAMARGRLVTASDVGGHRELIDDGNNGLLFRTDDARALAAVVSRLIEDTELQNTLRHNGRRFVERERNWATVTARYEPIYSALCRQTSVTLPTES